MSERYRLGQRLLVLQKRGQCHNRLQVHFKRSCLYGSPSSLVPSCLSVVCTCLADLPVMFMLRNVIEAAQACMHHSIRFTLKGCTILQPHTISSDTHALSCVCATCQAVDAP